MTVDYFKNSTNTTHYKAGDIIFDINQPGESMFVLREGIVEIMKDSEVIDTLEAGAYFGEMALVDKALRSASAVAKTDVALIEVDKRRFLFLVQETPTFALQIMSGMAERLRRFMDNSEDLVSTSEFKSVTDE